MTEPTTKTALKAATKAEPVTVQTSDEWKIQISKKINGDLWNIRARNAAELLDLARGLAEFADDTLEFLSDFVQAVIARGVQTDSFNNSGGGSGGNSAGGPPRCKHGEMKDLSSKGYRHRYYCPERSRANQCPPQD